jgi:hypothetical protein
MEIYKNTSIEDLENEIWVKTQEYDYDYCFSNMGRIKLGDKIVKQYLDKDLYCLCHLKTNGKMKLFRVHRIIAKYYIENKENKPQINHINSNPKDNRIENLEWVSHSENNIHKFFNKKKSSIYVGVTYCKTHKKWLGQIQINKKKIHTGYFNTELEAHESYLEYKRLNNINSKY